MHRGVSVQHRGCMTLYLLRYTHWNNLFECDAWMEFLRYWSEPVVKFRDIQWRETLTDISYLKKTGTQDEAANLAHGLTHDVQRYNPVSTASKFLKVKGLWEAKLFLIRTGLASPSRAWKQSFFEWNIYVSSDIFMTRCRPNAKLGIWHWPVVDPSGWEEHMYWQPVVGFLQALLEPHWGYKRQDLRCLDLTEHIHPHWDPADNLCSGSVGANVDRGWALYRRRTYIVMEILKIRPVLEAS